LEVAVKVAVDIALKGGSWAITLRVGSGCGIAVALTVRVGRSDGISIATTCAVISSNTAGAQQGTGS